MTLGEIPIFGFCFRDLRIRVKSAYDDISPWNRLYLKGKSVSVNPFGFKIQIIFRFFVYNVSIYVSQYNMVVLILYGDGSITFRLIVFSLFQKRSKTPNTLRH